jgi:protein SCO1/2
MKRFLSALLLAGCATLLAACGPSKPELKFNNTDVTGLDYAKDFALTDHTGKPRTLADFKGKVVVMFFGYTQCPDVCPTTMVEMANVMKELGPDADRCRCCSSPSIPSATPRKCWRNTCRPSTSASWACAATCRRPRRWPRNSRCSTRRCRKQPGSYTMDHTAGSYVFDPQGHIRLFVKHGQGPQTLAHDIKLLLN